MRRAPDLGLLLLCSCGAGLSDSAADEGGWEGEAEAEAEAEGEGDGCYASNDCAPGYYCTELGECRRYDGEGEAEAESEAEGEPPLPPETEVETTPPAVGDRFVYVALPALDAVATIDSATLAVESVEVGDRPEVLRTVPGQDVAVALNVGGRSISVLRRVGATHQVVELDAVGAPNDLALAPGGAHAVAFFRLQPGVRELPATLQDVTAVRLAAGSERAIAVSVGFHVREVEFSADGARAFAITDDGVSIIDLAALDGPTIATTWPVSPDPADDPEAREVEVTDDGRFAFVRRQGLAALGVVALADGALSEIPLPGAPSDLDLTADSAMALAVLRDQDAVALIEIPADVEDPAGVRIVELAGELIGSAEVTADGAHALLYTNAVDSDRLVVLTMADGSFRARLLEKPIRRIHAAPDSRTALVAHRRLPGDPTLADGIDEFVRRRHGYTLIRIAPYFRELQLTAAELGQLVFAPDGARAFATFSDADAGVRSVADIDLRGFAVREHPLGSPPVAVGLVSATGKAYVAQDHAAGRITFLDMATGEARTVTGFQLNSEVVE